MPTMDKLLIKRTRNLSHGAIGPASATASSILSNRQA
jgi:hypothetical protein